MIGTDAFFVNQRTQIADLAALASIKKYNQSLGDPSSHLNTFG